MHGVLGKRNNWLHSLSVIYETNLLSLISSWLDTNCQIETKVKNLQSKPGPGVLFERIWSKLPVTLRHQSWQLARIDYERRDAASPSVRHREDVTDWRHPRLPHRPLSSWATRPVPVLRLPLLAGFGNGLQSINTAQSESGLKNRSVYRGKPR
jgi:hypothetical protein